MKRKLLFSVALATMLLTGVHAANAVTATGQEERVTVLPSNWKYFGPGEYSSWRILKDEDDIVLQITCAGDLSSLQSSSLPWRGYRDIVTRVELQGDVLIRCNRLPQGAFEGFTAMTSASLSGLFDLTEISDDLFSNCTRLENVSFPSIANEKIVSVGKKAFCYCTKLTTLELPESVEQIGDSAFVHCDILELTLPKNLKKVGYRAFDMCNTVIMPKEIGEDVETVLEDEEEDYAKVFRIVRLVFPGTLQEWLARDNSWFMDAWEHRGSETDGQLNIDGKDVVDLVIPEGITEIKPSAFRNAIHIETVKFPSTLTKIGKNAFEYCRQLKAIDLPDNITELGDSCFFNCEHATTLKLPKNLTVIPAGAFAYCGLTDVTWPESPTTISDAAFEQCQLGTLVLPNTVTTLAAGAFGGNPFIEVTLPKNLKTLSPMAFLGSMIFTVNIPAGMGDVESDLTGIEEIPQELLTLYESYFGFPFVTDIRFGGDLNEWLAGSRPWLMENFAEKVYDDFTETEVPHKVNLYLAGSDEPLKEAVIPEGVTAIPGHAFHMTTLTNLSLPESLTKIGTGAFAGCTALATAETKAKTPAVLDKNAFEGIDENAVLNVYVSAVDGYKASDWVKYFKIEGAFAEYKVTAAPSNEALGEVTLTFDKEDIISTGEEKNSFVVGKDAKAHLVATPKGTARFVSWNDEAEGSYEAERDIVITSDFDYIAKFEKDSFTVSVTVNGIDPELVEIHGAGRYGRGDDATLSFTLKDEDHYSFMEWIIDKKSFEENETLVFEDISGNHNVQINFKGNMYTVTATVIPEGAGVVKGQGEYEYGSMYGLLLEPAEEYELKEWRDGIALGETSNILTGVVYGNINIEVVLQLKKYTVTVTANDEEMGAVIGSGSYEYGSTAVVGAFANEGYDFVQWSNGETANPLKFTVTEDTQIQAVFEKTHTVTVSVTATPTGTGTVEGAGTYQPGDKVTLTAVPAEGYAFYQWSDGNTDNPREIVVTEDINLICIFIKKDPTGVEAVTNDELQITKILRDGVLYIMYNGTMYNIQGQRVK